MTRDGRLILRTVLTTLSRLLMQGVALFVPAQTFAWPQAWVALAVTLFGSATSALVLWSRDKELLRERMSGYVHEGQPFIDKVLVVALVIAFLAVLSVSSFDVWHWHVLAKIPFPVSLVGLGIVIAGSWIWIETLKANAFGSVAVKLQTDRAHHVVDTGPYAYVRHPMYTGILMVMMGQPIWLGSWVGALVALAGFVILGVRCVLEEQFLEDNLEGYADYRSRVRHRLIPGVW